MVKQAGNILDMFGDQMTDTALDLKPPRHPQHPSTHDRPPGAFKKLPPDDDVDHAGFILEREKDHPLGSAGTLSQDDQPRNSQPCVMIRWTQPSGGQAIARREA